MVKYNKISILYIEELSVLFAELKMENEKRNIMPEETELDIRRLDAIGSPCRMFAAAATFEKKGGVLRLKRVTLVNPNYAKFIPKDHLEVD